MIANAQILGWGLVMVIAAVGWGAGVYRLISGFKPHHLDWGLKAAIGLGLTLALCGVINILNLFSRELVLYWIAAGLLLWVADWMLAIFHLAGAPVALNDTYDWDEHPPTHWTGLERVAAACGGLAILLLLLFQVVGWLSNTQFNLNDDYHAYLVFPERILQTGGMGEDPFSSTRLQSGLGGHYFLLAGVLSIGRMGNLNLLEPGLGLVLLVGLILGRLRRGSFAVLPALMLVLLAIVTPYPKVNVSALVMGIAMLCALWRVLDEADDLRDHRNDHVFGLAGKALIIGLLGSGLCVLKSSFIPCTVLMLVLAYVCQLLTTRRLGFAVVGEAFLAAAVSLLCLMPWMLSLKASSGTPLYPALGLGYHTTATHPNLIDSRLTLDAATLKETAVFTLGMNLQVLMLIGLGVMLVLTRLVGRQWMNGREATLCLLVGVLGGGGLMLYSMGGFWFARLAFPTFFTATLAILLWFADRRQLPKQQPTRFLWRVTLAMLCIGVLLGQGWQPNLEHAWKHLDRIRFAAAGTPAFDDAKTRAYRGMQAVIPQGEPWLVRLDEPFRLNFARNTIYVADRAGEVSPPPGMPVHGDAESLAFYLHDIGIRYIAYSYKNEANFAWRDYRKRTRDEYPDPWGRAQARLAFTFQRNLEQLGKTRLKLYDDGQMFVLDLASDAEDPDETGMLIR